MALILPPLTFSLIALIMKHARRIGSHPFIIQVLWLYDVADVELNSSDLLFVPNLEVVPVGMSFRVGIASNKAVVFIWLYFDSQIQITALEVRVKLDFILRQLILSRRDMGDDRGILFSYIFDCFRYGVDLYFIFFAILPSIPVGFMELN